MLNTKPNKLPGNVEGKYYVSEDCDGCAYCASVAPENFEYDKSTNTYYVAKQPENAGELELVLEAMEDCPVDAVLAEENGVAGGNGGARH